MYRRGREDPNIVKNIDEKRETRDVFVFRNVLFSEKRIFQIIPNSPKISVQRQKKDGR